MTSSIKALNNKKQANAADPTEYPFVLALVTFPTASKRSIKFLTLSGYPLNSAIPPALSAIGPNPLILKINTPVQNIPIVAIAVPKSPPIGFPCISYIPEASPK